MKENTNHQTRVVEALLQSEQKLRRESEERFRLIADNTTDTISMLDLQLNVTYISPSVSKLRGYTAEEAISHTLDQIFTVASLEKIHKVFVDQMTLEESGLADPSRSESLELEEYCKDGSIIWVEITVSFIRDAELKPTGILTLTRDVTKRKRAEFQLIDNEHKYRSLAESSPDNIIRYDIEGRMTYVNRNMDLTVDFNLGPKIGKTAVQSVSYPGIDNYHAKLLEVIRTGKPDELDFIVPDPGGELRTHHIRFVSEKNNEGRIIGALAIGRDITERVQAEKERLTHLRFLNSMDLINRAIQESNDFEQVMHDVLDVLLSIYECDRAWLVYPCDPEAKTWRVSMERTRPEYPGTIPLHVEIPMDTAAAELFQILRNSDCPVQFGPGSEHKLPVEMSQAFNFQSLIAMAFYPKTGKPWTFGLHQCAYPRIWTTEEEILFQEIGRRLTDSLTGLLMFRDLKESEEKLRTLMQKIQAAVVVHGADTQILTSNAKAQELLGLTEEQMLGKTANDPFWSFFFEDGTEMPVEKYPVNQILATKQVLRDYIVGLHRSTDEKNVWLLANADPVFDNENEIFQVIVTFVDITKHKLAELEVAKMNHALHASEERFSAAFRFSPMAIAIFRASDDCIVDVNEAFINSYGYSRKEIIGHTTAELGLYANPSDRDIVIKRLQNQGSVESFESDSRNKNGEIKTVLSAVTYININGAKHYLAMILDITERKKSEERLRLLSSALEAAANSIVITDKEARIIWANDAFSKLTGFTTEEAIGQKPRALVHSGIQTREFYQHMWKTILNGEVWNGEIINKHKTGHLYHEYLTITPVRNENNLIQHFIAVKQDITEQKRAEEELLKAKDRAEESNRLKSAFLATMNHELRTPLNHILGFSDLMRSGTDLENITDYAGIIYKSSQNLLEIIEGIFELALAEQSEIKLRQQTFKCLDLFLNNKSVLMEILENSGKKDQIELAFNADKQLLLQNMTTDRNKINQVLINIFKNAVKFTKNGRIEFGMKKDEPGWLIFYVSDTGIGIPEDKHKIIFEFFRQVNDTNTREFGGVGIGLAISKKIAEVMNGTLYLESEPNRGSTFYFRIPVELTLFGDSQIFELKNEIILPTFKGKIVLIAEDDPASMILIKKYLAVTGLQLIEAVNGKEAVDKLDKNPDLILMDLKMPLMDGYTATRIIKSMKPEIPVIALTAYSLLDDQRNAYEAGCDGIISKPVELTFLYNQLNKFLFPV